MFEPLTPADRDQLLMEMKRFIDAESSAKISIEATIREGHAAGEILSEATDMKADLIVMGTHGRTGFERLTIA